jgi:hypothetical protein
MSEPSFVLVTVEGLCARLSSVLSHRLVALAMERQLLVVWSPDDACMGHFLDHFQPLRGVRFIEAEEAAALPPELHVPRTIDYHELIRHNSGHEALCFADLVPLPEVEAAVAANLNVLGSEALAVHVRRTDHFSLRTERVAPTSDVDFYAFLDAPANRSRPIYLATDNAATQRRFLDRYGTRVRACTHIADSDRLRHTSLRASVVDLLTCAACCVFKGSAFSSFSDSIIQIRRAKGIASEHDEHEPSGMWRLQMAPSAFGLLDRPGGWWCADEAVAASGVPVMGKDPACRPPTAGSAGEAEKAGVTVAAGGPLCARCCSVLLSAVRGSHPRPSTVEESIALAAGAHAGSASRWLKSSVVTRMLQELMRAAQADVCWAREGLERLARSLLGLGCVGAADHPLLASRLELCGGGLGETLAIALVAAIWVHTHRSCAPAMAAIALSGVCADLDPRRSDGGLGGEPDAWLSRWRRTRLAQLRDGLAAISPHSPPVAAAVDQSGQRSGETSRSCFRCWHCLAPSLCGPACSAAGCCAVYCSAKCQLHNESEHSVVCPLVRRATVGLSGAAVADLAEHYYAWRDGSPGWRSTAPLWDRQPSTSAAKQQAEPLWEALPLLFGEEEDLYGPMYAGLEE